MSPRSLRTVRRLGRASSQYRGRQHHVRRRSPTFAEVRDFALTCGFECQRTLANTMPLAGVKEPQVQVLSSRPEKLQVEGLSRETGQASTRLRGVFRSASSQRPPNRG
jgi:hypothetical protein